MRHQEAAQLRCSLGRLRHPGAPLQPLPLAIIYGHRGTFGACAVVPTSNLENFVQCAARWVHASAAVTLKMLRSMHSKLSMHKASPSRQCTHSSSCRPAAGAAMLAEAAAAVDSAAGAHKVRSPAVAGNAAAAARTVHGRAAVVDSPKAAARDAATRGEQACDVMRV